MDLSGKTQESVLLNLFLFPDLLHVVIHKQISLFLGQQHPIDYDCKRVSSIVREYFISDKKNMAN